MLQEEQRVALACSDCVPTLPWLVLSLSLRSGISWDVFTPKSRERRESLRGSVPLSSSYI